MTHWKHGSLKVRLTRKLVAWQVIALFVFALVASVPLSKMTSGIALDPHALEVLARAVAENDGTLVIEPTKDLENIKQDYPDFWYFILTRDGDTASFGPIPAAFEQALINIAFIQVAEFGDAEIAPDRYAMIRTMQTAAGKVHIATGNGPKFQSFSWRLLLANRYFVGFSAALSIFLMIIIPFTLQRELRGVERVAEEADRIDVEQRGVRLSEDGIPEEVHSLVKAVNGALERLDDGIERRHRFMADAAHELRTPIAILQMRVDLLAPSPERDQLQMDIARLSNLADQLLDLQRIDMRQANIDAFDLVELAEEVTADIAPLAIAQDGEIEFETEARTITVRGDRLAIGRAITNLIQNAISHSGRKAHIIVSVAAPAMITVSDNGPGIPGNQRQKIFDPFYRVKPNQAGTGLGLTLVQEIVWRHKGNIRISTSRLGGAAFTIDLDTQRHKPEKPTEARTEARSESSQ